MNIPIMSNLCRLVSAKSQPYPVDEITQYLFEKLLIFSRSHIDLPYQIQSVVDECAVYISRDRKMQYDNIIACESDAAHDACQLADMIADLERQDVYILNLIISIRKNILNAESLY
jgi:hypothetical protein